MYIYIYMYLFNWINVRGSFYTFGGKDPFLLPRVMWAKITLSYY